MSSRPSPTWYIALVVVRHADRFVLVHEKKDRGWYLPAGRVNSGETLQQGAKRETLEEAGLEIELDGILPVEFTPMIADRDARLRVGFWLTRSAGASRQRPTQNRSVQRGSPWKNVATIDYAPTKFSAISTMSLGADRTRRYGATHLGGSAVLRRELA